MPPSFSVDPDQFLDLTSETPFSREEGMQAWEQAYAALEACLRELGSSATVFVVCGVQAAGKSTWVRDRLASGPADAVYFCGPLPSRRHRARVLATAAAFGCQAIAVWIQVPLHVALARNAARGGLARVPEAVIHHVHESLEPPTNEEGFVQVIHVATHTPAAQPFPAPTARFKLQAAPAHHGAHSSMQPFTIRRATLDDAPALAELAARTFADTFGADNDPEDLAEHLRSSYGIAQQSSELLDGDVVTLLAYFDQNLAGYAQVRRKEAPGCVRSACPVEIHRFYLTQQAKGSGLAAALMRAVRGAARELGGDELWLGVWERNPRAIAFYRKSGFVEVGSHVFMVGSDAQRDLVFVSALAADAAGAA